MSLRILASNSPSCVLGGLESLVLVREYDEERDKEAVEEMERKCEVGQQGLVTDLMGDPICRIRQFPLHVMLVAEYGKEKEIVGLIRGCVKTVTKEKSVYVKLAYILGLRVSPTHRRLGIGTKLVQKLEQWCKQHGATYAYMATDCTNEPSINLFNKTCSYMKFRTPTMLVQPVHAHYKPMKSGISIVRVPPNLSATIYRRVFTNSEFFPKDIDSILLNKLNLGTFVACPKKSMPIWGPKNGITLPSSFAILSVWNAKEVFKLQVKGVSPLTYACCKGSRLLDERMPWLNFPSIPDVFRQFGVYFLYGLHMEGKHSARLMKALCAFAHNLAKEDNGCGAIVAEVGHKDPVRGAIPHWRKFSWADLWCIKKLATDHQEQDEQAEKYEMLDWTACRASSPVIFVDPRDF